MTDAFCPHCMQELKSGNENCCPHCGREVRLRAQAHQLPIGTVLRGPKGHTYLIGKVKGGGGFGLTYIGKELGSGMVVAIKEYYPLRCQPQRGMDGSVHPTTGMQEIYEHGIRSFLSEASMLRAVRDVPSVVHVLDYFEANYTAYMVMEYLDGTTLGDLMQTQSHFEATLLLCKFLPLMQDLARIHNAGVLHRDIAPDNLMLMQDGTLKLLDFGCARSMEDGKSMEVVLKPGFAPIEQYQTRGQGPYTDVYALCASIYYCLTGRVPPAAPERLTAVFDDRADLLVPPSELGASIPEEAEQLLLWGLELQPSARPQNMEDLEIRMRQALNQNVGPIPPDPEPGPEPDPDTKPEEQRESFWKKHSMKLLLGLALGMILLLLLILIFR